MKTEAVFIQTNEAERNRVVAYERGSDGQLNERGRVATGARGDGRPHLTSQGSVLISGDGRHLLVTNAGSDQVSLLSANPQPELLGVVSSGGRAPKSVAEHAGLVYVLNTGDAGLAGFRIENGGLEPLPGSRRELGEGADPAQVGFTPDGTALVVTDRGTNAILVFEVDRDGLLGAPEQTTSAGLTPYGFTFAAADTLVVTEAFEAAKGKAAASSYRINGGGAEAVTKSLANGRSEICWAVSAPDGRYVFTTNYADGAVSCYTVSSDGSITLDTPTAGSGVDGRPGLRDEDISADGRFLYAIDADAGRVFGWRVDGGSLTPIGAWNGLPLTIAGLAAS